MPKQTAAKKPPVMRGRPRKNSSPKAAQAEDTSAGGRIPTRRRRPLEVKARIAAAATAAFTRHGFAGARMRSIAEDAGITIQLLTHHVKSKENLWKIIVEHLRTKFEEVKKDSPKLSPNASATEKLRAMIADIVHFTATVPQLHRLMTLEATQLTPRLIYLTETFAREPFNEMCVLIQEAQREGTVRQTNPQRLRFAIQGMAAVPFSVAAEYEYLTGKNPFLKGEIERTIELIDDLVFSQGK